MTRNENTFEEGATRQHKPTWRNYAFWATQFLIVIALIDGFLDISYTIAIEARRTMISSSEIVNERAAGWDDYKQRQVMGLGWVVEPVSGEGLNVDELGVRSTGTPSKNGSRGILLGSSQAFGHYLSDNETLASALERQKSGVQVFTVAGPSRTVAESMTNWIHNSTKIDAPDFVILLFSNIEIFNSCASSYSSLSFRDHQPAVVSIPRRILNKYIPEFPCASDEIRNVVVERSLYELMAARSLGTQLHQRFIVVIAPLLFGNKSSADQLLSQIDQKHVESLDSAIRDFRTRLAAKKLTNVIDLSSAFDGNGSTYFSDTGSHFTRAGAEYLAAKILERLPNDFFD